MVKLILEIKEVKNFEDGTLIDCDIEEIGMKATEKEQKISEIMKEKLGVNKKVQVIKENKKLDTFKDMNKEELNKIVDDFINNLFK